MESSTNFGACSCVTDVKNPISLARKICDKQSSLLQFGRIPPMMLAGDGASYFARETGLKMISSHQLISKKSENMYNYYRNKIDEYEKSNGTVTSPLDTVGAVAIDNHGNVAAGCSSGGIILKLSGRVGQAASFGAGCWSQKIGNHSTACCTTGNGEYLIKTLLAREICIGLQNCNCPTTKLNEVFVEKFLKSPLLPNNQESYGGALIVDYNADTNRGDLLWAHTTKMICVGYKSSKMKSSKFVASTLQDTLAGQKVIVSGIPFSL
jgi:taspase, threonine aspartase, 1